MYNFEKGHEKVKKSYINALYFLLNDLPFMINDVHPLIFIFLFFPTANRALKRKNNKKKEMFLTFMNTFTYKLYIKKKKDEFYIPK